MLDIKNYSIAKFNFCPNCGKAYPKSILGDRCLPCHECKSAHYFNRSSVSAMLIPTPRMDGLWIVKRADNGLWCLPCGYSEPGETVRETSGRETFEEMYVTIIDPENNIHVLDVMTGTRKVNDVVFGIVRPEHTHFGKFIPNEEILARAIMRENEPYEIAFPHHKKMIDRFFAGEFKHYLTRT